MIIYLSFKRQINSKASAITIIASSFEFETNFITPGVLLKLQRKSDKLATRSDFFLSLWYSSVKTVPSDRIKGGVKNG